MTSLDELNSIFNQEKDRYLKELAEYISFKSISAEENFFEDCQACASWLIKHLSAIGFKTKELKTNSQPTVYAERIVNTSAKTLLVYGHYDVQPAEKCPEWLSDPFELSIKGNDFFARGAGDNKGQTFYIIKAIEELIKTNQLKVNLKFIIEGQEESGSSDTIEAMSNWQDELKADCLLVCDTAMLSPENPVIALGMRGVATFNIKLSGSESDLHSGVFGGQVKNPATELTKLISSLFKADGTIAVKGYYDDMDAATEEEIATVTQYNFHLKAKETIGVEALGTEEGIHPLISNSLRPTIELNGIHSGYHGDGSNSIIPATAQANFSCRTAAGQNPDRLLKSIQEHLESRCPTELTLEFNVIETGCSGMKISSENEFTKLAAQVIREVTGYETNYYYEGATIPIIPNLLSQSTSNAVVTGFGLASDNWHGFNEKFSIDRFQKGFLFSAKLIQELGLK